MTEILDEIQKTKVEMESIEVLSAIDNLRVELLSRFLFLLESLSRFSVEVEELRRTILNKENETVRATK